MLQFMSWWICCSEAFMVFHLIRFRDVKWHSTRRPSNTYKRNAVVPTVAHTSPRSRTFGMFFFAFSLFAIANASSIPNSLGSDVDPSIQTNVLGPVSQLHLANGLVAPDGYNRS